MQTIVMKPDDAARIMDVNNAAVPNVDHADEAHLANLITMSNYPVALHDDDDALLGFVLTLPPGVPYGSDNYRWFSERYDEFVYVDRIVVTEAARNRGVGARLYDLVIAHAGELAVPRVTCEVNLDPPNPGSLRFHKRLGFVEVGEHVSRNSGHRVSLLSKELTS